MKLQIDGEVFEPHAKPRLVMRVRSFLDSLAPAKALTAPNLAAALGISHATLKAHFAHPDLSEYRITLTVGSQRRTVWANPKTIKAYKNDQTGS